MIRILCVALSLFATAQLAMAQSADEILEKARAKSRQIEEFKKALNDPDQNMRLATFQAMIETQDPALQGIALDTGLASADTLLQSLAFKTAIMGLDRLHLELQVDPSQPAEMQEAAQLYLSEKGNKYVLEMGYRDPAAGTFSLRKGAHQRQGEVSGTLVTFKYVHDTGTLRLTDDDSVRGPVSIYYRGKHTPFIATAKIR